MVKSVKVKFSREYEVPLETLSEWLDEDYADENGNFEDREYCRAAEYVAKDWFAYDIPEFVDKPEGFGSVSYEIVFE